MVPNIQEECKAKPEEEAKLKEEEEIVKSRLEGLKSLSNYLVVVLLRFC